MSLDAARAFFNRPGYLKRTVHRTAVRHTIVREMLGPVQRARILDLGCGDGQVSLPLVGETNELTLVDFAPRMLEAAAQAVPDNQRDRVNLVQAAVHEFEPPVPYDAVICLGVLAHVPSIADAVTKVAACLKPSGKAIIELTPNPLGWKKALRPYHAIAKALKPSSGYQLNQMVPDELVAIASRVGLSLRGVRRHNVPLPGLRWWPYRWHYRYAFYALSHQWLSRFGIEHVMLFTKD